MDMTGCGDLFPLLGGAPTQAFKLLHRTLHQSYARYENILYNNYSKYFNTDSQPDEDISDEDPEVSLHSLLIGYL